MAEPTTIHSLPDEVFFLVVQTLPSETATGLFDLSAVGRISQVCQAWSSFLCKVLEPLYISFYQRHFSVFKKGAGFAVYKNIQCELKSLVLPTASKYF